MGKYLYEKENQFILLLEIIEYKSNTYTNISF